MPVITTHGSVSELSKTTFLDLAGSWFLKSGIQEASGEKWILVRRDTHYRENGLQVESSNLRSSTRVFVRGGKNLDGELEAYEVVWGEILAPAGPR